MKRIITSEAAPAAIGPYSQAVRAGGFLFLSGQIALDADTGEMVSDDVEKQTHQVIQNMQAVLGAAGAELADIVKTTIFLADLADFGKVNAVYGGYFESDPPARATVEVARLPKDARVEIECIALV